MPLRPKNESPHPVGLALAALCLVVAGSAMADPILHEYFDFDEQGDDTLDRPTEARARAATGAFDEPAEAQTSPNRPKDAQKGNSDREDAYQLDSNTTRPDQVGYEDPFTPSIPPFKRLYAYDGIDAGFQLIVSVARLEELPILGNTDGGADLDQFHAALDVASNAGEPLRIPSVGPSAMVLSARLEPDAPFRFARDSAENWFIISERDQQARLSMHLAIDRAVFGSPFLDPEWSDLRPLLVALPSNVRRRGLEVADNVAVSRALRPSQALARLVTHFRSFSPSEELPVAVDPGALYREIALSKKGVCRHRSYAFMVTALALGLPTRFVRNEAHAWVEVHDATRWHRIDLGGAAGQMQLTTAVDVAHVPPADPFEWPVGGESADDMTDAALHQPSGAGGSGRGSGTERASEPQSTPAPPSTGASPRTAPSAPLGAVPSAAETTPEATPTSEAPETTRPDVHIEAHERSVFQGGRVRVAGNVAGPGGPCALVRVDILLTNSEHNLPIGSLVTDASGRYSGFITLPPSVAVGDYELTAVPHGRVECARRTEP